MSRRTARENVYKLTFEFLFYGVENQTTLELLLLDTSLSVEDRSYMVDVYRGIIANYDDLKATIAKYTDGFDISRVYKSDLAILILCTYELTFMSDDIPHSVAISEAVELAKRYSTDKSSAYVNGVLSSICKSLNGEKNEHN